MRPTEAIPRRASRFRARRPRPGSVGDLELFDCAAVRVAVNPKSDALRARADVVFEPDLTGAVAWLVAQGYLPAKISDQQVSKSATR